MRAEWWSTPSDWHLVADPGERFRSEPRAADRSFPFIGLSDADDPVRSVGRRPDEDDHRGVEGPECDDAILAVVLPVALNSQRRAASISSARCCVGVPEPRGWLCAFAVSNSDRHNSCCYNNRTSSRIIPSTVDGASVSPQSARKPTAEPLTRVGEDVRILESAVHG